jgi:hypothetical protein
MGLAADAGPLELGAVLAGRYEVRAPLGRGGAGAVYRVLDRDSGQERALKVHAPAMGHDDDGWRWRLRREFYLMAQLAHPNIVRVHDWGEHGGLLYYTMDLVPGRDAADLRPLAADEVVQLLVAMGAALGFVHARGYVHQDVKPRNVRIPDAPADSAPGPGGRAGRFLSAVLMDFGLLAPIGTRPEQRVLGTPGYQAPEVLVGGPADPRSDLFALGVSAYGLLTTSLPNPLAGPEALREQLHHVPPLLAQLIGDLLALDLRARPGSTAELLERLSSLTPAVARVAQTAPSYLLAPPLIGREVEIEALWSCWGHASTGHGGTAYVVAPAGVGKSHLLRTLALEMRVAGAVVAETSGELGQQAPFSAAGRLLESLEADARVGLRSGAAGSELRAAFESALDAAARAGAPVAILVDDLQWCDAPSVELLEELERSLRTRPVLLVCAVRQTDSGPEAALLLDRLRRGSLLVCELQPLDREGTRALLAKLFGEDAIGADLVDHLHETAGGHPYLTLELARTLVERHLATFEAGRWRLVPDAELVKTTLPRTLERGLTDRLEQLSSAARPVAEALAVLGGRATASGLAQLTGENEAHLFAALDELEVRRVALVHEGQVAFVHPRLQEVLYGALPLLHRQAWHRRAAAWLRLQSQSTFTRGPRARVELAGSLGLHLARGGPQTELEALPWLRQAGQAAYEAADLQGVNLMLGEAAQILERRGGPAVPPELAEIWEQLGISAATHDLTLTVHLYRRLRDYLDPAGVYRNVTTRARYVGPKLAVLGGIVETALRRLPEAGLAAPRQALNFAGRYALCSAYLGICEALIGELANSRSTLDSLDRFAAAQGGDALGFAALARAILGTSTGELELTRRLSQEAPRILARSRPTVPAVETRRGLAQSWLIGGWVIAVRGEPDREGSIAAMVDDLDLRDGDPNLAMHAMAVPCALHARRGEVHLMLAARSRALERCRKLNGGWQETLTGPTNVPLLAEAGMASRIRDDRRAFDALMPAGPFKDVWAEVFAGLHLHATGDPAAGAVRMDRAALLAEAPEVRSPLWRGQALWLAAEAWLAAGEPGRAWRRARAAIDDARAPELRFVWLEGRAQRVLARVALQEGDLGRADHALRASREIAERLDNPGERAHVLLLQAELLAARGELMSEAQELGWKAEHAFVTLGNGLMAQRAAGVRARAGGAPAGLADDGGALDRTTGLALDGPTQFDENTLELHIRQRRGPGASD